MSRIIPADAQIQASSARDQKMHRHAHREGIPGTKRERKRRLFLFGLTNRRRSIEKTDIDNEKPPSLTLIQLIILRYYRLIAYFVFGDVFNRITNALSNEP